MLHALTRAREMCVTDLADALEMKPQAISNQLQRLVDKGMVASRRNGNNIFTGSWTLRCSLLDSGLCLMEDAKERAGLGLPISPTQNFHAELIR
jgi:DNA-binding transcriptional ArsR family regulator